jgi:amino acid transporter
MAQAPPQRGLVRAIGRYDLTAAVINAVIGSSVFGMPARLSELLGTASPWGYVIAGAFTLLIVLCFAEVASRFRDAGGPYLYTRECYGPLVGFEVGWLTYWVRVTAVAANLNIFAEYLGRLLPAAGAGAGRLVTMTLVLGVIVVVNLVGVRAATWAVNLFTLAKLAPLGFLIVLGLPRIETAVLASQAVADPRWLEAIVLLVFAYGGFDAPLIPAGEAKSPQRDTAFALLVALGVIATVYALVQLAVAGLVPSVAGTPAPIAAAFGQLLGDAGVTIAAVAAMTSVWGYATGNVLQSPRLLFAMSERGQLPPLFARVHARFRTPHPAILAFAACTLTAAGWGSFEWNATLSAIVRLVTYALTCAAVLVLRTRRPAERLGFRLPGAWLLAPVGVLSCAALIVTRPLTQAWVLAALIVAGALLWGVMRRRTMGR